MAHPGARREQVARLLLSCPDRPGIVASVAGFLAERGANILQFDQHTTDPDGGTFFMRVEFRLADGDDDQEALRRAFALVAEELRMTWQLSFAAHRKRIAVFVSRYDHCLAELLWRWRRGELYADIPVVVSNHAELEREAARFDVHFEHVPVPKGGKPAAEARLLDLVGGGAYDLIVLARYMQILSAEFLKAVRTPIINIHHSFLPAFAGADPYARAHQRGVKIIGATAHYVTEELDAGPIIEQDVARVTHRESVDELVRRGADLERIVLLRAVEWHIEDRVLPYGSRTVVFP
jgi:formyltetrahydrofolate deformylase